MGLCAKLTLVVVVLSAISIGLFIRKLHEVHEVPSLPQDAWWGPGQPRKVDESIRPFKIDVPDEDIDDLNKQLDRWLQRKRTPSLENIGFEYGFNSDYLKQVVQHWRNKYQWKERQLLLNQYKHYKTNVNGLDIHFMRVTPEKVQGKSVLPLLLLHGWPGSIKEFYGVIPLLTKPRQNYDFVFELVIPSLPGYGFSEGAARVGMGPAELAVIMNNLMRKIGFDKYYVQGGDWGSVVGRNMAVLSPDRVLGLHTNMCPVGSSKSTMKRLLGAFFPSLVVEEKYQHLMYPLSEQLGYILEETGYFHIQATKPDTVGTSLEDSPVGLAAYILEKFSTWTNKDFRKLSDGNLTKKFTLDDLLDNIMIYWTSGSITTSQRLYAEYFSKAQRGLRIGDIPIKVPSAVARYHHDVLWLPDTILRDTFENLLYTSDIEDGGHFAAFELPRTFSDDLWVAFDKIRQIKKN